MNDKLSLYLMIYENHYKGENETFNTIINGVMYIYDIVSLFIYENCLFFQNEKGERIFNIDIDYILSIEYD
jgi:hypothetical protein